MYSKRVFVLMSLIVVFAMLMTACGTAAKASQSHAAQRPPIHSPARSTPALLCEPQSTFTNAARSERKAAWEAVRKSETLFTFEKSQMQNPNSPLGSMPDLIKVQVLSRAQALHRG